ncbi:MAG: AraC family transcriptional regulator [Prevotella sp.]|nr:AraC family transcriptional regulator [Prevotella sp.]
MNKKTLYLLYMSVVALLLTGCTGGGTSGKRVPQAGDTLYTEERAMAIYDSLPERALLILDSAEVVGNMTDYRAALFRAKVLSKSTAMQQQDSAVIICEALLRHDEAQRNIVFRGDVLELLVNASRIRHDYEEMVHWTTELAQLLRGQGLATEALRTDADLGLAMTHIGQVDEGLAKIDNAIRQLDMTTKFNELDAWLIAAKRKINVLQEQEIRSDEVITLANQIQQRLDDFAARPDDYHDGTYREPPKEDIPTYHDFYYAQACAYKAAAYTAQGNRAAAQREIVAFRQYPYSHSLDGRMIIAQTQGRLGDYETMLATYDDFERYMVSEGDTLNGARIEILRGRAEAAIAAGHTTQAYDYMNRYDELKSQLSDNLQRSKAHLYAARYHTLELETALHQERVIHMKNLFVNVLIGMVLFIVVAAAVYLYRQRRLLSEKNYILVQKIEDAQEYKRLYQSLKTQKNSDTVNSDDATDATRLEAMTDAELFDYISDVVRHEQLFLRPVCDRQTLVERFHLSEKRIGAAFSKGSPYGNVSNFVRNARLEYACQLLRKSTTMSIADVAAASGFPSYPRFAMDFKASYSISPTEYRRQSQA